MVKRYQTSGYYLRYRNVDHRITSLKSAPSTSFNRVWHMQWRRRLEFYSRLGIPVSVSRPHKNAIERFAKKYPSHEMCIDHNYGKREHVRYYRLRFYNYYL